MIARSFILILFFFISLSARAAEPFEIKEGDRVLLLGDTLLERENTYGYLETRMHEQFPDRHFIVRNLSWAGETPRGWSRASFDPPGKGFERLKEDIGKVRPTVVFLGFGMAASLQEMTDRSGDITLNPDPARYGAEPMSAARFKRELGELMDAIVGSAAGAAPPGSTRVSRVGSGVTPERTSTDVAKSEKSPASEAATKVRDGVTPSPTRETRALPGAAIRFVLLSPIRHEDLRAIRPGLPDPAEHNRLLEQYSKAIEELAKERGARFVDLFPLGSRPPLFTENGIHFGAAGYRMLRDEFAINLGWRLFKSAIDTPKRPFPLRAAVIRKNELFFHQFRPANSTYLFGFRKHEQGQNAREIPLFDPLVEAQEKTIASIRKSLTRQ